MEAIRLRASVSPSVGTHVLSPLLLLLLLTTATPPAESITPPHPIKGFTKKSVEKKSIPPYQSTQTPETHVTPFYDSESRWERPSNGRRPLEWLSEDDEDDDYSGGSGASAPPSLTPPPFTSTTQPPAHRRRHGKGRHADRLSHRGGSHLEQSIDTSTTNTAVVPPPPPAPSDAPPPPPPIPPPPPLPPPPPSVVPSTEGASSTPSPEPSSPPRRRLRAHDACYSSNEVLLVVGVTCAVNFAFILVVVALVHLCNRGAVKGTPPSPELPGSTRRSRRRCVPTATCDVDGAGTAYERVQEYVDSIPDALAPFGGDDVDVEGAESSAVGGVANGVDNGPTSPRTLMAPGGRPARRRSGFGMHAAFSMEQLLFLD